MNTPFIRFAYGLVIGLAIIEAIVGEWRVVLCAAITLIVFGIVTQGGDQ